MPKISPWNKGKSVGQTAPVSPHDVQTIKQILANAGNLRDLALFSMGMDTMLRGGDLLGLKVADVTDHTGKVVEQCTSGQQKTGKRTVVALLPYSRHILTQWIPVSGKLPWHDLFTSMRTNAAQPLSTTQYRCLIKRWAASARLDPRQFSTYSVRRTKATLVDQHTHNVEVVRQLLEQASVAATSVYLGIAQRQALELARKFDI